MLLITEIIKFLGTLLSTVMAITAVYQGKTKSVESGRLTRKGKQLIGFAVTGLVLAGCSQMFQVIHSVGVERENEDREDRVEQSLDSILDFSQRREFPLDPVVIRFGFSIPFEDERVADYISRLVEENVDDRCNSIIIIHDQSGSEKEYFLLNSSNISVPEPDIVRELTAYDAIYRTMLLVMIQVEEDINLEYWCCGSVEQPKSQDIDMESYECRTTFSVNWNEECIKVHVCCADPYRLDTNEHINSVIDIIDSIMTWTGFFPFEEYHETDFDYIELEFPHQRDKVRRNIDLLFCNRILLGDQKSVTITADHVGLAKHDINRKKAGANASGNNEQEN